VKVYPSLAAGALKAGQVPAARLYLLIRALDPLGRGVVEVDQLRARLTDKKSKHYLCGWRRLRQIINDGRGRFWERDAARVFLFSPVRIAEALGVERLSGRPVAIPVKTLLAGKHETAAAFMAAWHAGRKHANPISRKALQQVLGVVPSTQRTYDKTAKIKRVKNIRILNECDPKGPQSAAWDALQQHGNTFLFTDHVGQLGKPGTTYTAANMPSTYSTKLKTLPRGRTRKINRQLRLVTSWAQGNEGADFARTYHDNEAAAWDARGKHPHQAHYYKRRWVYLVTAGTRSKITIARAWTCVDGKA
jgi:hypothetical protein